VVLCLIYLEGPEAVKDDVSDRDFTRFTILYQAPGVPHAQFILRKKSPKEHDCLHCEQTIDAVFMLRVASCITNVNLYYKDCTHGCIGFVYTTATFTSRWMP
jgi:hypothetical protein